MLDPRPLSMRVARRAEIEATKHLLDHCRHLELGEVRPDAAATAPAEGKPGLAAGVLADEALLPAANSKERPPLMQSSIPPRPIEGGAPNRSRFDRW